MKSSRFPHDKKITVLRANGSTYMMLESEHMMRIDGCTESEVRVSQAFSAQSKAEDFMTDIPK